MRFWLRELRVAARSLSRTPTFVVLTVSILGLAIGVTSGIFSVVDAVLLDPLPYEQTDRLVRLAGSAPGSDLPEEFPLALEFLFHFRDEAETLTGISTYNSFTNTLRVGDRVERVPMSAPTLALFEVLGVEPIRGRLPVAEDEDRVMVISHDLWTTWFDADPGILGQSFYAAGEDRTVIGVMGPDFWFPNDDTLLWIPVHPRREGLEPGRFGQAFVARLAPGADLDAVTTELATLAAQLPERFGGSAAYARLIDQFRPVVRPLEEEMLGALSGPLWVLLGSMVLVLIIACVNVAHLFMVRAERQQTWTAVRRALGAGRGRLIGGRLAEAFLVATLAGVVAVALAWLCMPLLLQVAPPELPRLDRVTVGPMTLLFTFALSVLAALLCGLGPAVRFSAPSLGHLRSGGRGSIRGRRWGRQVLLATQTALALVLLVGSALLLQSFQKLRAVDPGYDTADIFTFQIAPEGAHLQDAESYARFHTGFMERVAALPGVERVGIVENVPLNEGVARGRFRTEDTPAGEDEGALLSFTWSAGDYFRAMGIEVFRGRAFTPEDHVSQRGNVLVSRSAAELLWPGENPLGKRLRRTDVGEGVPWETVVGVVDDVLQYGFRQDPEPMVYLPLVGQDPATSRVISSPAYVVKTPRAEEIAPEIRALVRELAPSAPMYRMYTLEGLAADSMVRLSFTALTLGIASVLALLLGVVGLYGVLSYSVAERSREIGLRMALGAVAARVRWMIVRQGVLVLVTGVLLGFVVAFLATRSLGPLLFGVEAFDLATYTAVAALVALVGLGASYLPARRASRVDPMVALRDE